MTLLSILLDRASGKKPNRKPHNRFTIPPPSCLICMPAAPCAKGFPFPLTKNDYEAFADSFGFEETPDQAAAIASVMEDMTSDKPMDRLICGDVGFGKTEVALRAAFIAVMGGKQVALLAPTTLLAEQHAQTFRDRFADWPVRISELSRFRTQKQVNQTIKGMEDGTVDIVIGTHKLLSKDVSFNRLGLIIIDEEHRFGVRQKEALKAIRAEVDVLTLTATPIPANARHGAGWPAQLFDHCDRPAKTAGN